MKKYIIILFVLLIISCNLFNKPDNIYYQRIDSIECKLSIYNQSTSYLNPYDSVWTQTDNFQLNLITTYYTVKIIEGKSNKNINIIMDTLKTIQITSDNLFYNFNDTFNTGENINQLFVYELFDEEVMDFKIVPISYFINKPITNMTLKLQAYNDNSNFFRLHTFNILLKTKDSTEYKLKSIPVFISN